MFYTARQLEDLWKAAGSNGQLVLPYRARLTPAAADWVKLRRLSVGYSDISPESLPKPAPGRPIGAPEVAGPSVPWLWWCDGPCGTAKAALMAQARESSLSALDRPAEARQIVPAIRHVAAELRSGKAAGAILIVQSGAAAMVYANRCPSIRAILGTCLDAVEQGIQQIAANVLVIEYQHKTLSQMRNLLGRFVRAHRELSADARKDMQELASCG